MDTIENKISIAKYYRNISKAERENDNEVAEINKYSIDESVYQRASCYSALVEYFRNRGYDGDKIRKILHENGKEESSGFEDLIIFLEGVFNNQKEK